MKNKDFLNDLVTSKGWRLLDFTDTHVLIERDSSSCVFGNDNRFATLGWDTNSDHLFWGHYDLTLEEAVQSLKERK